MRKPVYVGDLVSVFGTLVRIGRTSITVHLEAWVTRRKETQAILQKGDVREKMLKASFAVKYEGPEQLRARTAREVPMWKELVDKAGIRER